MNKENIGRLQELYDLFTSEPDKDFEPGELVTWKDGLRNRAFPKDGFPAIVINKLAEPIYADGYYSTDSNYRDRLDIICGVVSEPQSEHEPEAFLLFYYDSRRLQHFE